MRSHPVKNGGVFEFEDFAFPNVNIINTLNYCEPYLDQMWAASVVGNLLGCDFRDAKDALIKFKISLRIKYL